MPYEEFSYANINDRLIRGHEAHIVVKRGTVHYAAYPPKSEGFIYFANLNDEESSPETQAEEVKAMTKYKLKFHLSLPELDRKQFAKGFQIALAVLIDEGVNFKIAAYNNPMSQNKNGQTREQGKDLTIYAEKTSRHYVSWAILISRTIEALHVVRIPPGFLTTRVTDTSPGKAADYEIPGTDYMSYRYEIKPPEDFFGRYLREHPLFLPDGQARAIIYVHEVHGASASAKEQPENASSASSLSGGYK